MRPRRVQFTIAPVVVVGLVLLAGVAGSGSANLRLAPPVGWGDDERLVVGETPTSAIGVQEQTLNARQGASSTAITLRPEQSSRQLTDMLMPLAGGDDPGLDLGLDAATADNPGGAGDPARPRTNGGETTTTRSNPQPTASTTTTSKKSATSTTTATTTATTRATQATTTTKAGGPKPKDPKARDADPSTTSTTKPGKTPDTAPGRTTTTPPTSTPPPTTPAPTTPAPTAPAPTNVEATTTTTTNPDPGGMPADTTTTTRPGRRVGQQP